MKFVRFLCLAAWVFPALAGPSSVPAVLKTSINASAKIGDEVVVETISGTKTVSGVKLPKGTLLTGQILNVQSSQQLSSVVFRLDHALTRDGRRIPIRASIQSINLPTAPGVFQNTADNWQRGVPTNGSVQRHPVALEGGFSDQTGVSAPARGVSSRAAKTWSGVPGVYLSLDQDQDAVLTSRDKAVALKAGTVLTLRVLAP